MQPNWSRHSTARASMDRSYALKSSNTEDDGSTTAARGNKRAYSTSDEQDAQTGSYHLGNDSNRHENALHKVVAGLSDEDIFARIDSPPSHPAPEAQLAGRDPRRFVFSSAIAFRSDAMRRASTANSLAAQR